MRSELYEPFLVGSNSRRKAPPTDRPMARNDYGPGQPILLPHIAMADGVQEHYNNDLTCPVALWFFLPVGKDGHFKNLCLWILLGNKKTSPRWPGHAKACAIFATCIAPNVGHGDTHTTDACSCPTTSFGIGKTFCSLMKTDSAGFVHLLALPLTATTPCIITSDVVAFSARHCGAREVCLNKYHIAHTLISDTCDSFFVQLGSTPPTQHRLCCTMRGGGQWNNWSSGQNAPGGSPGGGGDAWADRLPTWATRGYKQQLEEKELLAKTT